MSRERQALAILTVLGIVFRSELAILLGTHTIYFFLRRRLSIQDVLVSGVIGLALGVGITVPVDSFFWQRFPTWPEFISFYFNVMEGKSSDWGVSPFHYYISGALPKLLLNPLAYGLCLPLAIGAPALRTSVLDLITPNLAFILIYSLQPHKEWRFIIYCIPPLTAACARGASYIWDRRGKSSMMAGLSRLLMISTLLSFAYSAMSLLISSLNYPGAIALNRLHAFHGGSFLKQPPATIAVHMDVLTCQTGATLFLQHKSTAGAAASAKLGTNWTYDKTDSKSGDGTAVLRPEFWASFDYALAERPEKVIGKWDLLDIVYGYGGVRLVRPGESWGSDVEIEQAWDCNEEMAGDSTGGRKWGDGPWAPWSKVLRTRWLQLGTWASKWVTHGFWVDVRLVPMIRILRRTGDAKLETSSSTHGNGRVAAS